MRNKPTVYFLSVVSEAGYFPPVVRFPDGKARIVAKRNRHHKEKDVTAG
jgi:hypothetical protein